MTVTNTNGEKSSRSDLLNIAYKTNIDLTADMVIDKHTKYGKIKIEIPAYTYNQNEDLTVVATLINDPVGGGAVSVGIGMNVSINSGVAGANDITITMIYNESFATGLNKNKFVLAYYDDSTNSWVELPSSSYPTENRVTAKTKTLGRKFMILQAGHTVAAFSGIMVYPNPYKPNSSGEYGMSFYGDGVVFSNLVKNFKIKIFNIAGDLIYTKDGVSDSSDNFFWDTKCDSGDKVASGVYIYIIENANDAAVKTKGKLSIIR